MNNEEIKKQLREIATAANSLAEAATVLSINVSTDVPNIEQQDAVNEEQLTDGMAERLTNGYKNYCRAALEAYLERKITWWQLKKKMLMPDLVEWVKACGQDASCPVGGGNAAVNQENGDSLKDLLGMEVISVGDMPCDACNYAGRPCVKVELVGGTYLCLAPQPGSIITE